MEQFTDIFFVSFALPLAICVVLPVMVVWLTTRGRIKRDNLRAQILMEAIRNNAGVDADKLADALSKPKLTEGERRQKLLLRGLIWGLVGVALLGCALYVGLSSVAKELTFYLALSGGISLAVGLAYIITWYVISRKK